MRALALALIVAASTAAAKPSAPTPKPPPSAPRAPTAAPKPRALSGVHAIDWRNFTYPATPCDRCQGSGPIKIVKGRSVPDPILVDLDAYLVRVSYFDATGDEEEEALVEIYWRHSPKGYNRRWYLYSHDGGRLELVWQGFSLAYDEELSGVVKVTPAKRSMAVEEIDAGGKRTQLTYVGAIEGKLRVTKRARVGRR
jgi:hypothetical protein